MRFRNITVDQRATTPRAGQREDTALLYPNSRPTHSSEPALLCNICPTDLWATTQEFQSLANISSIKPDRSIWTPSSFPKHFAQLQDEQQDSHYSDSYQVISQWNYCLKKSLLSTPELPTAKKWKQRFSTDIKVKPRRDLTARLKARVNSAHAKIHTKKTQLSPSSRPCE